MTEKQHFKHMHLNSYAKNIWTQLDTQTHTDQLLIKENWEKWISVFQTPLPPFFQEAPSVLRGFSVSA